MDELPKQIIDLLRTENVTIDGEPVLTEEDQPIWRGVATEDFNETIDLDGDGEITYEEYSAGGGFQPGTTDRLTATKVLSRGFDPAGGGNQFPYQS